MDISATEANAIGYYLPIFANHPLPYSKKYAGAYVSVNGNSKLSLTCPDLLVYGCFPRLILMHIISRLVLCRSENIALPKTANAFLKILGKTNSGGVNGSHTQLMTQLKAILQARIEVEQDLPGSESHWDISIVDGGIEQFMPGSTLQWPSTLRVTSTFLDYVLDKAYPIDSRVVHALSRHPLAMDIYLWSTHRVFRLGNPVYISWGDLACQFGNTYERQDHFRSHFLDALNKVALFYPDLNVTVSNQRLGLLPSRTHIPQKYFSGQLVNSDGCSRIKSTENTHKLIHGTHKRLHQHA